MKYPRDAELLHGPQARHPFHYAIVLRKGGWYCGHPTGGDAGCGMVRARRSEGMYGSAGKGPEDLTLDVLVAVVTRRNGVNCRASAEGKFIGATGAATRGFVWASCSHDRGVRRPSDRPEHRSRVRAAESPPAVIIHTRRRRAGGHRLEPGLRGPAVWLGFEGGGKRPFFEMCRTQVDIAIKGDDMRLAEEMHSFWLVWSTAAICGRWDML